MSIKVHKLNVHRPTENSLIKCVKCGAVSGDDWTQCEGSCPIFYSPHFDRKTHDTFSAANEKKAIKEATDRVKRKFARGRKTMDRMLNRLRERRSGKI